MSNARKIVTPEYIAEQRLAGWPDIHPEDHCHRCGVAFESWFADRETWLRGSATFAEATGREGILCHSCFAQMYEAVAGPQQWRLVPLTISEVAPTPPRKWLYLVEIRELLDEGRGRPWSVRVDVSGFVSILDAHGMFVADFGSGSTTEADMIVAVVNASDSFLSELDETSEERSRASTRISQAATLLGTAHRKLAYLVRDYPGDKESAALLDSIAAWVLPNPEADGSMTASSHLDHLRSLESQCSTLQQRLAEVEGRLSAVTSARDEACNRWEFYAQRFASAARADAYEYPALAAARKAGQ